ncbi:unnamed protein product, partial [Discosporangium mesarthrocarpum]
QSFRLGDDLGATILSFLGALELSRAAAVSRGWCKGASSRPLWRGLYARDFLGHMP